MREIVDFQAAREKALAQTRAKLETALQQRYDALLAHQRNVTAPVAYEALNRELNAVGLALDALHNAAHGSVRDLETAVQGAQALLAQATHDGTVLSLNKKP